MVDKYVWPSWVRAVGIEWEGAFNSRQTSRANYHYDGSVHFSNSELGTDADLPHWEDVLYNYRSEIEDEHECDCEDCVLQWMEDHRDSIIDDDDYNDGVEGGELVSAPHTTFQELRDWYNDANNRPFYVNSTCGLHFHMSFTDPEALMAIMQNCKDISNKITGSMYEEVKDLITDPGDRNRLRYRLRSGHEEYAGHNSSVDGIKFYEEGTGNRYRVLNFTALEKYGTVECRVLPAFISPQSLDVCLDWIFAELDKVVQSYEAEDFTISGCRELPIPEEDKLTEVEITLDEEAQQVSPYAAGLTYSERAQGLVNSDLLVSPYYERDEFIQQDNSYVHRDRSNLVALRPDMFTGQFSKDEGDYGENYN